MKKLYAILALMFCISIGASAQLSYWDTTYFSPCEAATNTVTPQVDTVPGLSPGDTALPCGYQGYYLADTIYFKNFTSFSGLQVNYLKIDSIYLPAGLCWSTNKATNQFNGGEDGVIVVQGIPTAQKGQYKLRIIIDVNAGPGGTLNLMNQDAETLLHFRYHLRVITPLDPCPWVNTTDTTDNYLAYACSPCGINEVADGISNLSVVPNPFERTAIMSFTSENQGTYTVKMTNILGAVVSTKEVNIINGQNDIVIDRNGLSSGMYLLSISNGKSVTTRKVVIE